MKRTVFMILIVFLSVLSIAAHATPVGKFNKVSGKVDLTRPGMPARPVYTGDEVTVGDIIRAKSKSKAEIIFVDGSILRIAQKSRVKISDYTVGKGHKSGIFNLFRGKIENVVKKSGGLFGFKKKSKFEVHTATAICGVRGTDFFSIHQGGLSSFIFKEGQGYGYTRNRPDDIVNIRANQAMLIINPDVPPIVRAAGPEEIARHSDDTAAGKEDERESGKKEDKKGGEGPDDKKGDDKSGDQKKDDEKAKGEKPGDDGGKDRKRIDKEQKDQKSGDEEPSDRRPGDKEPGDYKPGDENRGDDRRGDRRRRYYARTDDRSRDDERRDEEFRPGDRRHQDEGPDDYGPRGDKRDDYGPGDDMRGDYGPGDYRGKGPPPPGDHKPGDYRGEGPPPPGGDYGTYGPPPPGDFGPGDYRGEGPPPPGGDYGPYGPPLPGGDFGFYGPPPGGDYGPYGPPPPGGDFGFYGPPPPGDYGPYGPPPPGDFYAGDFGPGDFYMGDFGPDDYFGDPYGGDFYGDDFYGDPYGTDFMGDNWGPDIGFDISDFTPAFRVDNIGISGNSGSNKYDLTMSGVYNWDPPFIYIYPNFTKYANFAKDIWPQSVVRQQQCADIIKSYSASSI
ncbi:MAG: FecR domain-containing protein, partial [Deltaproteobacteria bacterium]|nr:FecR domain-containing protein [Deltaproteobacteria bacterium]